MEYNQRYWQYWKFITLTKGVWYNLLTDANEFAGTKICKHLGWENNIKLEWFDDNAHDGVSPYEIEPEYLDSFKAILNHLIEKSPIKTVYVLACYQREVEKEIILGTFSVEEFFKLMSEKKVHANICYIISGNS